MMARDGGRRSFAAAVVTRRALLARSAVSALARFATSVSPVPGPHGRGSIGA